MLASIAGQRCDFFFVWSANNGGTPKTKDAINQAMADYLATFHDQENIMELLEDQIDAWRSSKGMSVLSDADLAAFDAETGLLTKCKNELSGLTIVPHIAAICDYLSTAAVNLGCDDATAAALKSISSLMFDSANGRSSLSRPETWTEARLQANQLFQSESIAGIPLHVAWGVALEKLEFKTKQLLENKNNSSNQQRETIDNEKTELFVRNPLQNAMMDKLKNKALRTDALARAVPCDRRKLFKPGGIKELIKKGKSLIISDWDITAQTLLL